MKRIIKNVVKTLLISLSILFLLWLSAMIYCVIAPTHDVSVDYTASRQNFDRYFDEIEALIEEKGYSYEPGFGSDNFANAQSDYISKSNSYLINNGCWLSVYLWNDNGKETFSIDLVSPHVEADEYQCVELLISISDILSGHKFTENDLNRLLEGDEGFRFRSRESDEMIKGQLTHNEMWVGVHSEWGADYIVSDNNPLSNSLECELCDEFKIGGLTKTGTKK